MRDGREHRGILVAAAALLLASSVLALPAAAGDDPREELEENLRRQDELAEELDTLTATAAELSAALDALDADLRAKEAAVRAAQEALAAATLEAEAARRAHAATAAELAAMQARLDEMVVDALVHPPSLSALDALVSSRNPSEAMTKEVLRGTKVEWDAELIDRVAAAEEELAETLAEKAAAEAEAEELSDRAARELAELSEQRLEHEVLAAGVRARIEADHAEANEIADQNAELARSLAEDARVMAAAIAGRPPGPSLTLVDVEGIRVHELIAPQLRVLLDEAASDGIELSGGGYRTTEQQIALRRAHCGEEGVFTAPASSCSPPTARPGTSMHELGLAVDFTAGGRIIDRREHPAFVWLAEHAPDYGFENLPSEPWHWSVDGS